MSVAGPTLSSTVVVVDVNDAEQVSQFLARLEVELRLLRRYQHLPLDLSAHLGEEDRAVFRDATNLGKEVREMRSVLSKRFFCSCSRFMIL